MPKGHPNPPLPPPMPRFEPEVLAEAVVDMVVSGKAPGKNGAHRTGPMTSEDYTVIRRMTGEAIEKFDAMLYEKLAVLSDATAEKIKVKLAADAFKTNELAFLFQVVNSNRTAMAGRSQIRHADINVQINQYGANVTKAELISALEGRKVTDLPGAAPVEQAG